MENPELTPRDHEREPGEPLLVTLGLLASNGHTELWQTDDPNVIRLRTPGEPDLEVPTRIKTQNGKQYLECTTSAVLASPAVAALLQGRFETKKRKAIAVHQLSATIGLGAKLVGEETGRVAVHHLWSDTGDNRAQSLAVLATSTHDQYHAWFGRIPKDEQAAYLASLDSGNRVGELPADLKALWLADRERLEEWEPVVSGDETLDGAEPSPDQQAEEQERPSRRLPPKPYYPDNKPVTDLSLDFSDERMVVAAAFPAIREKQNDKGEPLYDDSGRIIVEQFWRNTVLTDDGVLCRPRTPIPQELCPYKAADLHGFDNGTPRWSPEGVRAFHRGDPPPPDLAPQILEALTAVIEFANPRHAYVVACYIALTYVFPLARRCPFLALHSGAPGAGKSTLAEIIALLAFNAFRLGVSTMALIARVADRARCTLVLDEQEKLASWRGGSDLIELLNSRSDAGTSYRVMGRAGEPLVFNLFGPTVVANLGGLVPTLRTRSILIEMQPRTAETAGQQAVTVADAADWTALRDALYLWARAHWRGVKCTFDNDEAVRLGSNRHQDLWRLMLAVAFHFGGEEFFHVVAEEAQATELLGRADDVVDAQALAVASLLDDWKSEQQMGLVAASGLRQHGRWGFECSLGLVVARAAEKLEEDEQRQLASRKVAAFCRGLGLGTSRLGWLNGATGVEVDDPDAVRALLTARFPHLFR